MKWARGERSTTKGQAGTRKASAAEQVAEHVAEHVYSTAAVGEWEVRPTTPQLSASLHCPPHSSPQLPSPLPSLPHSALCATTALTPLSSNCTSQPLIVRCSTRLPLCASRASLLSLTMAVPPSIVAVESAPSSAVSGHKAAKGGGKGKTLVQEGVELAVCASAIYLCFLGYGLLHERLYKRRYGEEGEKFTHSLFLVGCQSVGNCAFAAVRQLPRPHTAPRQPSPTAAQRRAAQPPSADVAPPLLLPLCSPPRHSAAAQHGALPRLRAGEGAAATERTSSCATASADVWAAALLLLSAVQIAFSYIGAMYNSNLALNYMSYPAQVRRTDTKRTAPLAPLTSQPHPTPFHSSHPWTRPACPVPSSCCSLWPSRAS